MKRLLSLLFLPIGLTLTYLIAAVMGALIPAQHIAHDSIEPASQEIILLRGPIHYDILLPNDPETRRVFSAVQTAGVPLEHPNARWLSIGWGSAAFYTSAGRYRDIKLSAVWRAASGDQSVLRFEIYGPLPHHSAIKRVQVSPAQLRALRASILADLGAAPQPLPLEGFSHSDVFFAAQGRFHLLKTCNVWVGQKLSSAGLSFGIWTPTPFSVTLSRWWNGLIPD